MRKIQTTTSEFKKALKTITDILTPAELKMYDVGIGLMYEGVTGTLLMEHPTEKFIVSAQFSGEEIDSDVDTLFFMSELLNDFKQFRKKEKLTILVQSKEIEFLVEDDVFYRSEVEKERIRLPYHVVGYQMETKALVDTLKYGQAITKTTFDESTMELNMELKERSLIIKGTNFAQLMVSSMEVDTEVKHPFAFSLSAKLITKVRNTIERGRGKQAVLFQTDEYIIIESGETTVAFENRTDKLHIDSDIILKSSKITDDQYTLSVKETKSFVSERYKALRQAEDSKNEDGEKDEVLIAELEQVYLSLKGNKSMFQSNESSIAVHTRDLHTVLQKTTSNCIVIMGEHAFLLRNTKGTRKTDILFPVKTSKGD